MNDLIPRLPRRMRQPTKDQLRDHVSELTEECIRLRTENAQLKQRAPLWRRLITKAKP